MHNFIEAAEAAEELIRSGALNEGGGNLHFSYTLSINTDQLYGMTLPAENDPRFGRTPQLGRLHSCISFFANHRLQASADSSSDKFSIPLSPRGNHFFSQDDQQKYTSQMTEINRTVDTLRELGIPFQATVLKNECKDVEGNTTRGPIRVRPNF